MLVAPGSASRRTNAVFSLPWLSASPCSSSHVASGKRRSAADGAIKAGNGSHVPAQPQICGPVAAQPCCLMPDEAHDQEHAFSSSLMAANGTVHDKTSDLSVTQQACWSCFGRWEKWAPVKSVKVSANVALKCDPDSPFLTLKAKADPAFGVSMAELPGTRTFNDEA